MKKPRLAAKSIPFIFRFSRRMPKKVKEWRRKKYGKIPGHLYGCCELKAKPFGFMVWIKSPQPERELVDSLYHEFTHAMIHAFKITRKELSERDSEFLCGWIGYLAKCMFSDRMNGRFGKRAGNA